MPEPTYNTIQDNSLLLTYLQQQYKRIAALEAALAKATKPANASMNGVPLTQAQLDQIRSSLSANGAAQFNVQSLLGVLAQVQNTGIPTFPSLPDPINPIYQQNAAIVVAGVLYINNGSAWVSFSVGITSVTVAGGSTGLTGGTVTTPGGTITLAGTVNATHGGTGIDSHSATGIPSVAAGTWSVISNTINTSTSGGLTAAFTANMVGSTGGPTTAAQNGWLILKDSGGNNIWIPVWK